MPVNPTPHAFFGTTAQLPSPAAGAGQMHNGDFAITEDDDIVRFVAGGDGNGPRRYITIGGTINAGATDIFADSTLGNDANPGTAALPVQTYRQAWVLAWQRPSLVAGTIHLAGGTYALGVNPHIWVPPAVGGSQPWRVIGTPTLIGTFTATAGTAQNTVTPAYGTVSALLPPPGVLNNLLGRWITGANAGKRFMVIANTGVALTWQGQSGAPIVAGDQFVVEDPRNTQFIWTGSFTYLGAALIETNVGYTVPLGSQNNSTGLVYQTQQSQANGVYYASDASGFSSISFGHDATHGASLFDPNEHPCPCTYDGTLGALFVNLTGLVPARYRLTNANALGVQFAADSAGQTLLMNGVHTLNGGAVGVTGGANAQLFSGIYSNLVSSSISSVGPGSIGARQGSNLVAQNCNIAGSGIGGIPVISLDQSDGEFRNITGANVAASDVFSLRSGSSAECTTSTFTNVGGTSNIVLGGATTTLAAVQAASVTDIAAGAPELCSMGPPT
jgi:hypothetical protein